MKRWKQTIWCRVLLGVVCGALSFFWFFFHPYSFFIGWADAPYYTVIILVAVLLACLLLDAFARVPAVFVLVGAPVQWMLAFLLGDIFGRAVGMPDSNIAFYNLIFIWNVVMGSLAVTASQFFALLLIQFIRKRYCKRK